MIINPVINEESNLLPNQNNTNNHNNNQNNNNDNINNQLESLTSQIESSSSSLVRSSSSPSPDFRIEIHTLRGNDINLQRNLTGSMQENISSLIHQARSQLERQTDRRTWRVNFSNVFQGVRPFVQQANSINSFRTWTNSYRYIPLNNENHNTTGNRLNNDNDSITINLDSVTESGGNHQEFINRRSIDLENRNTVGVQRTPRRPLIERVAELTRNDPPDLIGSSSMQRNGNSHNEHGNGNNNNIDNDNVNNNNNDNEEGAVDEVFAQIPEARRIFNTFSRYIPLIFILLAKIAYDQIEALTDFAILIILFIHSNTLLKHQIAKQTQRKVLVLFRELLLIFTMIFLKIFAINRKNPFVCLLLFSSINETPTLGQILYSIAATDFLIKLITISIKILIVMFPQNVIKYKGRGRYFVLTEALSQLYRSLAPIQLWLIYLLDPYTGMEKILGILLSATYMVAKGFDLFDRAKLCKKAFIGFFRQVNYGKIPTKDEIQTAGGQCPICHDNYDTPVKLDCNHIFCELCVGTWFTREQTCPLCRAQVAEDPSWQNGATSFFMQLY